jgi:hypothetical protein
MIWRAMSVGNLDLRIIPGLSAIPTGYQLVYVFALLGMFYFLSKVYFLYANCLSGI